MTLAMISLLGLVGCGNDSGNTANPGTATDSPTTEETTGGSIRFTTSDTEIEKGYTKTFRVNTSSLTSDDKTVLFSVVQEGEIIQLAEQSGGDVSIKVKGLRIGTATLVATSVANTKITASIEIQVVAVKNNLRTVWKKISKLNNYTISSINPDIDEETPTSLIKVTPDAVVAVDKNGSALIKQDVQLSEDSTENMSIYGIAISSNDLAYYLFQKADGSFYLPDYSIQTSGGLLRKANFLGAGEKASSFLEVSTFYGLQAINPGWLTNVKSEDNTYEIAGSEDEINAAYAEALLWGLVDPVGKSDLLAEKFESGYTAPEAAELIDTTITVINNDTVSITITETESQITHVATLTDKETTVLDENIANQVKSGAASVSKPKLNSGLQDIIETLKRDDYSMYQNLTYGKYYDYYAPTYYWNGVTAEILENFDKWSKENNYSGQLQSGGYVVLDDGIYSFTLTENFAEDGTTKIDPTIVIGTRATSSKDLATAMGYFSKTETFDVENNDIAYTFRALSTGSSTVYYSTNATVSDELSTLYFGGYTLKQVIESWSSNGYNWVDYGTEIVSTYSFDENNEAYISAIQIGLGTFGFDGQNGYMFPMNLVTEPCSKTNPYDAQIKAAMAAYKQA